MAVQKPVALFAVVFLLSGCADYLNHRDTITLAAGDTQRANLMLQSVDPFNPDSGDTHIEGDGAHVAGVMARYQPASPSSPSGAGNCPTDSDVAADGSRCGKRSAQSRPGGS